jgi:hypothetical protein
MGERTHNILSIVLARGLRRPPASMRRINAPPRLASHKRVGTKPLRQRRSPARCEQCVCETMRVGHKELTYAPPSQNDAQRTRAS